MTTQTMVSLVREAMAAMGAQAGARMGAWRVHAYGGLAELRLDEARVPPLRAADELLVRVHSSSLNPLDVAMIGEWRDFRRNSDHSSSRDCFGDDVVRRGVRAARAEHATSAGGRLRR